ncbi:hypothetical protein BJX62DRAFT_142026 [Aspergillus germanicus]
MAQDGGVGNAVQEGGMIFGEGLEMYVRRPRDSVHEREKGKRGVEMPNPRGQKIDQRNWRSASRQDRASQMSWSLPDCSKARGNRRGLQAGGCSWTRRGSDRGQKLHGEEQRAPRAVTRRSRSSTLKRQSPRNAGENEVSSAGENARNESMTMRLKDS